MSIITTASGLVIEDTVIGQGAAASAGRDIVVHYAGWLADGTQFDSSKEKQDPFEFTLVELGRDAKLLDDLHDPPALGDVAHELGRPSVDLGVGLLGEPGAVFLRGS